MIAAPYRTAWKLHPPASRQRVRPAQLALPAARSATSGSILVSQLVVKLHCIEALIEDPAVGLCRKSRGACAASHKFGKGATVSSKDGGSCEPRRLSVAVGRLRAVVGPPAQCRSCKLVFPRHAHDLRATIARDRVLNGHQVFASQLPVRRRRV